VTLAELVRVAGARWAVEDCFRAAKNEAALDHYQVRKHAAYPVGQDGTAGPGSVSRSSAIPSRPRSSSTAEARSARGGLVVGPHRRSAIQRRRPLASSTRGLQTKAGAGELAVGDRPRFQGDRADVAGADLAGPHAVVDHQCPAPDLGTRPDDTARRV